MTVGYYLINQTKKERVCFSHLPVFTRWEITVYSVSASLVTWYLFANVGDKIQFVSDDRSDDWPFDEGSEEDSYNYPDVTDKYINDLIELKVVKDHGVSWRDEDEPEIYDRAIEHLGMVVKSGLLE